MRPYSSLRWLSALSLVGLAASGCADPESVPLCGPDLCATTGGVGASSGGAPATGGATATTGGNVSGGSGTTGGSVANTGGLAATGGALASSGGSLGTGGLAATGGALASSGGGTSLGGTKATGGSVGTGGSASTGGKAATGGSASTGGKAATGGTTSGGQASTGGASTGGTGTGGATTGGTATGGNGTGGNGTGGTASGGTTSTGGVGTVVELALGKPATAKTVQTANPVANGNDGLTSTRFCAADGTTGNWWRVDLGAVHALTRVEIMWEFARQYGYLVEVSSDDVTYTTAVDRSATTDTTQTQTVPISGSARYVRITATTLTTSPITWMSFFEVRVYGT